MQYLIASFKDSQPNISSYLLALIFVMGFITSHPMVEYLGDGFTDGGAVVIESQTFKHKLKPTTTLTQYYVVDKKMIRATKILFL
jgi:hypothetical protein